jgi:hypothetical protein
MISGSSARVVLAQGAGGHDWGQLNGFVYNTSSTTHDAIALMASAAAAVGIDAGTVGGSAGETTLTCGSTTTEVYDFNADHCPAGANTLLGASTLDAPPGAIAFDVAVFADFQLPPSTDQIAAFAASVYHELAHLTYQANLAAWCAMYPAQCSALDACLRALPPAGQHSLASNPCSEAYASSIEASKLCVQKHAVCANGSLGQVKRAQLMASLDLMIEAAFKRCSEMTGQCQACDPQPSSMPADWSGCGGFPCPC